MSKTQPAAAGYPQRNQSNVEDTTSSSRISSTKPNKYRRHSQQQQDIFNKISQMSKTQPAAAGYPKQNQTKNVEDTTSSSRISSTKPNKCRRHNQQRQDILNKTKQMSKTKPAAAGNPKQNQTNIEDTASSSRISSTKSVKCRRHNQQQQDILNKTKQKNVEDTTSSSRISSTKPNKCRRHNQQRQDILNKTKQMSKTKPAAGYPQQNQTNVEDTASSGRISSTKPNKCRRHSQQQDILNKTKQMSKTQRAAAGYLQQNQTIVEDTASSSRISSTKPVKCRRHSQQQQDILNKTKQMSKTKPTAAGNPQQNQTNIENTASSSRISSTKSVKCRRHSQQQQVIHSQQQQDILNKTKQMSKTQPAAGYFNKSKQISKTQPAAAGYPQKKKKKKKRMSKTQPAAAGYPQQNQTNIKDTASSSRASSTKPNKCRRHSQ